MSENIIENTDNYFIYQFLNLGYSSVSQGKLNLNEQSGQ